MPNEKKCDGIGIHKGPCTGEVQLVEVSASVDTQHWEFYYCQTAIEGDRANGFTVEVIQDKNTDSKLT